MSSAIFQKKSSFLSSIFCRRFLSLRKRVGRNPPIWEVQRCHIWEEVQGVLRRRRLDFHRKIRAFYHAQYELAEEESNKRIKRKHCRFETDLDTRIADSFVLSRSPSSVRQVERLRGVIQFGLNSMLELARPKLSVC